MSYITTDVKVTVKVGGQAEKVIRDFSCAEDAQNSIEQGREFVDAALMLVKVQYVVCEIRSEQNPEDVLSGNWRRETKVWGRKQGWVSKSLTEHAKND